MRNKELEKRVYRLESRIGSLGWECAACGRFYPNADVTAVSKKDSQGHIYETIVLCSACQKAVKDAK